MRERQLSIADSLMDARSLVDGRYRLDGLIRRSATTTIHVATHRNGASAWLKMPVSAAHAESIALEARIANTVGSPLVVRDDGVTPDGVPYLVLDPPDAESLASLRARGRAGARLPFAHAMTAADALLRVFAAVHAMGYAMSGVEDEGVLVFSNGDVALLDLHALVPATASGVATDVFQLSVVLAGLVTDVAEVRALERAGIEGVLAAAYADVVALQSAWRTVSPDPIALPPRVRPGSVATVSEVPSTPRVHEAAGARGASSEAGFEHDPESSIIGFLRSGGLPSSPQQSGASQPRVVMYDPLSKAFEVPRLVQATIRIPEPASRGSQGRWLALVGATVAVPVVLLFTLAVFVMSAATASTGSHGAMATTPTTMELEADPTVAESPPATVVVPPALPAVDVTDELELTALLRSEGAPAGREVLVDGKAVGTTPLRAPVPCGLHTLQMIAGAPKQTVDFPCGGERVVRYDAKGRWTLR